MLRANYPLSADEFWRLPAGHGRRELVRGEVRVLEFHGAEHGVLITNIAIPLYSQVKAKRLGVVFGAGTGFLIARNPDSVRAPDVSFVTRSRIPPGGIAREFVPGSPDLVVEIVLASDTLYEVEEKVAEWLNAGTRLVWVANARRRTVTVYNSTGAAIILGEGDVLSGGDVVPGFQLPVSEIFC